MKAVKFDYKYDNDIDLLDTAISVFAITQLNQRITKQEKVILREYIVNGCSETTDKGLLLTLKITDEHLRVIRSTLGKKGFLKPHPHNQRLKLLNEDLLDIKEALLDNKGKKLLIINFEYGQ